MNSARPQVIQLTPAGRGAVASLRLIGPDAAQRAAACVRLASGKPLTDQPLRRILFAHWGTSPSEDVVLSRLAEDVVEVHCHGGTAAVTRILEQLRGVGFEVVPWQRTKQAAAIAKDDAIARSACLALASAPTRRTAAILLDQLHGALARELERIVAHLRGDGSAQALALLDALLARAPLGLRLTHPWRIVLRGAPNVGKSSLANALVGYARAIVAATPGTTRDVVTAGAALSGWPVELADTAGERPSEDPLEQAGVARAQAAAQEADLVLEVLDARDPASVFPPSRPSLRVFNKVDLLPAETPLPGGIAVSALTGQGLRELEQAIVDALVPASPSAGTAVPFLAEHVEQLRLARTAIHGGDALGAAGQIAGVLRR